MNLLMISDIHLKTRIFHGASEPMKEINVDLAVCPMDIADDSVADVASIGPDCCIII